MLRFLKGFFKAKHPDVTPKPEPVAPYKVEPPTEPAVVNMEVFKHLTVDGHGDVHEIKAEPKAKKAPAKKKPSVAKTSTKPKTSRKPKAK